MLSPTTQPTLTPHTWIVLACLLLSSCLAAQNVTIDAAATPLNRYADQLGIWVNSNADVYRPEYVKKLRDNLKVKSIRHGWQYSVMDPNNSDRFLGSPCDSKIASFLLNNDCSLIEKMPMSTIAKLRGDLGAKGYLILSTDGINYTGTEDENLVNMTTAERERFYLDNARRMAVWGRDNGFRYFEVGNENDLDGAMVRWGRGKGWTGLQYGAFALRMAKVIKEVYPDAQVGINGGLRGPDMRVAWWDGILAGAPNINDYIDFVVLHRYEFGTLYPSWRDNLWSFGLVQADVQNSIRTNFPGKPIHVTETSGFVEEGLGYTAAYRGIINVEMLGNMFTEDNIEHVQHWGTRWGNIEVFELNSDDFASIGTAQRAYTEFMKPHMIANGITQSVRYFAATDPEDGSLTIWFVNHAESEVTLNVDLTNFTGAAEFQHWDLRTPDGDPYARNLELVKVGDQTIGANGADQRFTITVPPTGIAVAAFGPKATGDGGAPDGASVRGEIGTSRADHTYTSVKLAQSYTNPIVVGGPLSTFGGDAASFRFNSIREDGFKWKIEEWSYLDQRHVVEDLNYLVVEAGRGKLAGGQAVIASKLNVSSDWKRVTFATPLSAVPLVLTGIATDNEAQPVTARLKNVDATGFDIRLQEEENGGDGSGNTTHAAEEVHYVAIEPGSGELPLGAYSVAIEPPQQTHQWRTVAFSPDFTTTPAFIGGVQTYRGGDVATLRSRAPSASGIQLRYQEEQSGDGEIFHTPEVVGYAVFARTGTFTGAVSDPASRRGSQVNVALNKPATQSSTLDGRSADLAVDGDTNGDYAAGSVTHTSCGRQDWWRVDLQGSYALSEVKLYNRSDFAPERLSHYEVTILDSSGDEVWSSFQRETAGSPTTLTTKEVVGRYIQVQLNNSGGPCLSIAELEAFGIPVDGDAKETTSTTDRDDLPVTIYPNPTDQQLRIDLAGEFYVDLFDINGRQLLHQQQGSDRLTLSLAGYPAGVYQLRLRTATGKVATRKVVLHR